MSVSDLFKDIDREFLVDCKLAMDNNNDPSHGWDHVVHVATEAHTFAQEYEVPLIPLILAAITHDTFSGLDRVNHHLRSGEWVRHRMPRTLHSGWTEEVAKCCEQHRASYTGEYSGVIQEAFASADRGILTDESYLSIVKRSYQYSLKKTQGDHAAAVAMVVKHMPEKFGSKGYTRYPGMYADYYSREIALIHSQADSATTQQVESIINL